MKNLLSTKDVARLLGINEKMVYTLVSEKGLPATKVTGKWIFPGHLVEQWIETNTINYPSQASNLPPYHGLLIIAGSNDPLLEKTISLFNRTHTDHIAVFGNIGSMGGLAALKKNRCHIATSHLLQDDDSEYNFDFATRELDKTPAVVNFCRREQGLLLQKGNPKKIKSIADLAKPDTIIVNRPMSTDFLPLRWERYDLLISKEKFFDKGVQLLIGLLHEKIFSDLANSFNGYDINSSGKVIFPYEDKQEE
ncbi:MAG: helix-turn-helix transcriptional regulator [Deltaproteobacteria bacterium]|nr:helix-turn-helix transcriptional regulator [Deltaproteobacteria bacterium]